MQTRTRRRFPVDRLASAALLSAPPAVLGLLALHTGARLLVAGAVAQLLLALLLVPYRAVWRAPVSGILTLCYLIALGFLVAATRPDADPVVRLARGGLLGVALIVAVGHDLTRTGLGPRRLAADATRRLLNRTLWPATAEEIAELPEVRALGRALDRDPAPAALPLADPRPEVRVAVLSALSLRRSWRPREAELVLAAVRTAPEPAVRAAGVAALRCVTDPDAVADLAASLRDRAPEVRRATLVALLGGDSNRWPLIRDAVRDALADPTLAADGAISGRLCDLAICDLSTWATEPEPLAGRAVRSLVAHYAWEFHAGSNLALPAEVARQVIDPQTPPGLRVELASLLRDCNRMTPELLDRMTDSDQPGPLRVLAAEILLGWNPSNADAIDVLRGLGRQANRETALVIARLLQTYLRVDVGLPSAGLPVGSKHAAEVARRVFQWATARQGSAGLPVPAARLSGLRSTGTIPVPHEAR